MAEKSSKNFFVLRVQRIAVCGGVLFVGPLIHENKVDQPAAEHFRSEQTCTVELTLGPTNKNIRMAALVDVALKCFSSVNVCRKKPGDRKKPTGLHLCLLILDAT